MANASTLKLTFAGSEMTCNAHNGADLTHLVLNGKTLIKPRGFDKAENPWLFPFPNRLSNGKYRFEGKPYEFPHNDYGRPNALHGFVLEQSFSLKEQGSNDSGAWMSLEYTYGGHLAYYPFPFTMLIKYALLANELKINISIDNTGETNMPAGLGWHPYFDLPSGKDMASLHLPPCDEIEVDDLMIPTGKKHPSTCFDTPRNLKGVDLDTCFEVTKKGQRNAVGLKAGEDYEISVWQDSTHEFIQVYTPDDGQSIAIEPMTCGIDALNTREGLKVLAPGENWEVACGVKLDK